MHYSFNVLTRELVIAGPEKAIRDWRGNLVYLGSDRSWSPLSRKIERDCFSLILQLGFFGYLAVKREVAKLEAAKLGTA